ncbi:unnamed protein product, partial [marine sediment metagenome]
MKRLLKITFILALILCFAMPASAIKILPYSMPLQDIMRWDKYEATLKLSNPEGEAISVAWPSTVDLWNYDGTTWTFDLPTGNKFAFSKETHVNTSYDGIGGTDRSVVITQTITTGGAAISEALRVEIVTPVQTGSWADAIVGVINYGTDGDAGGGMAAAVCGEIGFPDRDVHTLGGNYYCFDAEMNIPTNAVLNNSTSYFPAFMRFGLWGGGADEFDDHG